MVIPICPLNKHPNPTLGVGLLFVVMIPCLAIDIVARAHGYMSSSGWGLIRKK